MPREEAEEIADEAEHRAGEVIEKAADVLHATSVAGSAL